MKNRRVFIGLNLSGYLKKVIPLLRSTIDCDRDLIKWVTGKYLHLTLSFLGEIDDQKVNKLSQSLTEITDLRSFKMTISGTGVFPNGNAPKILWLDIDKGNQYIVDLQQVVDEIAFEYKIKQKEDRFVPHVTIGRIKQNNKFSKIDVSTFLNTVYSPIEIPVKLVILYESQLTPKGAIYTELSTFPLT